MVITVWKSIHPRRGKKNDIYVDGDNFDHNDDEDKNDNQNDDDVHLSGSAQELQPHCEKSQQSVNTSVSQNLQMIIWIRLLQIL